MGSIDWTFLEAFFGTHGKLIAAALALAVAVISLLIWMLRYLSDRIREREREKLDAQLHAQQEKILAQEQDIERRNDVLRRAEQALRLQRAEIEEREKALDNVRVAFTGQEHELWCLTDPRKPDGYDRRMSEPGRPPIVMVANLKGGVGKTTLTANLAAHFSKSGLRVLVIDVDYQGSLSNMMLSADACEEVPPGVRMLLDPRAEAPSLADAMQPFTNILDGSAIVPSRYDLAAIENQVMVEYLLREDENDGRYRLARHLLDEMDSGRFDIALIDAPPRLTAGAINAFCASTHLLVPTVYDELSAEAVGTFLNGARTLKSFLNSSIDLLGVVGMLTQRQPTLVTREENAKAVAAEQIRRVWRHSYHFFDRHIPRRASIAEAAGNSIAYHESPEVRGLFEELGQEIAARLNLPPRALDRLPPANRSVNSAARTREPSYGRDDLGVPAE
jgi:chromosome partitioning protein